MGFSLDQAQELLNKGIGEAEEVIKNPFKVDEILVQLEKSSEKYQPSGTPCPSFRS